MKQLLCCSLEKRPMRSGGRGRLTSLSHRKHAIELIDEARKNGARLEPSCKILGITSRTYQKWTEENQTKEDQRPSAKRPVPKNKLSIEERELIIRTVNETKYASLPPSQIVPMLADEAIYIASNPNEVWRWDITWLHREDVRGLYYKLYLILDSYSRKVIGYEVWETENATYSELLVRKTY